MGLIHSPQKLEKKKQINKIMKRDFFGLKIGQSDMECKILNHVSCFKTWKKINEIIKQEIFLG